jgi:outer membrane protein, heavy metal efflux system
MRLVALVSFVVLWSGSTALAQSPIATVEPPPLHLADAIAWAREHHPSVAAASARIAAAQQAPAMARSLMPPMLDATIWQWPVTSINPGDVNMYMFMIEQELPGRGKRDLRAIAAEREVGRMTADSAVRARAVVTGVLRAYAALRATEHELAVTREAETTARDLVRATEATYAAGSGMQSSVVRAALAETELTERLVMLQADADMRRVVLNSAMGRAPSAPIGALDDTLPFPIVPSLASLIEEATAAHPELGMARADVASADAGLAVARSESKPDWVVQGGYMLMPGDAGAWTARVGLTWPTAPWAKKRLSAATLDAQARILAAQADLDTTRQQIVRMVAEARASLVGTLARLDILRNTMRPQSVHLLEATRLAFASGKVPLTEVVDAQKMQLQAEVDIARTTSDADIAWAALEAAVGSDIRSSTPIASSPSGGKE